MKKFIYYLLLLILLLPTHTAQAQTASKIWVISDLHYLSPQLHDQTGKAYQHIKNTGAGKDFDYGNARMDSLIYQISQEKPTALIISGDLTLNGEYQSMADLADYFAAIEALGTEVFVIPGNHDISSGWARQFEGEKFIRTQQVLPQDFTQLMQDFGYAESFSQDAHSLSYASALDERYWLIMLDSNIYTHTADTKSPITQGRLKAETLTWLESLLIQAKQQGIRVLPVIHHNTVTHFKRLEKNYTLDNADQLQQLLSKYQIPLTLSGHIHAQHVALLTQNDWQLTDIVTGAFSSYPSYIGQLDLTPDDITYHAFPLAVEAWAKATDQVDTNLLHYANYMANTFNISSRQMAFREMIEGSWYDKNDPLLEEVADYVALTNLAFFAGKPLNHFDLSTFSDLNAIRQRIDENASNFFKSYIQSLEQSTDDFSAKISISLP